MYKTIKKPTFLGEWGLDLIDGGVPISFGGEGKKLEN